MKTIFVFLTLVLLNASLLKGQYFVDHDLIQQHRQTKTYYKSSFQERQASRQAYPKDIYLSSFGSQKDYTSDLKVGFSKRRYSSNEDIYLTLKRENSQDQDIMIVDVSCQGLIDGKDAINGFSIKPNEQIRIKINPAGYDTVSGRFFVHISDAYYPGKGEGMIFQLIVEDPKPKVRRQQRQGEGGELQLEFEQISPIESLRERLQNPNPEK